MNNLKNTSLNLISIFSFVLFSTYCLGTFFPEVFWSTHNLSFGNLSYSICILTLLLTFLFFQKRIPINKLVFNFNSSILHLFIAVSFGILCYNIPIAHDYYGDAYYIQQDISISIEKFDNKVIDEMLKFDWLKSKVGLDTFYEIHYMVAYLFGINGKEAVKIVEAIFGAAFVWIWIKMVFLHLQQKVWRSIFIITGLTSPLLAVYMGHFETYAISFLAILFWFYNVSLFLKKPSKRQLYILPLVFLLTIQTHITNWMLAPSLAFCFFWRFKSHFPEKFKIKENLNWKGLIKYCLAPIFIIGSIGYVVLFDAQNGPRYYDKTHFEEVVFLPIFTDEPAPYDRYNLFSFNHIWDYLCLTWQWSLSLILLLLLAFTKFRKQIDWNNPFVLATGVSFVILFCLFFVLNPLLGIVIDWDLFSTPAISCFAFVLAAYSTLKNNTNGTQLYVPILVLSILGTSFWVVNASKKTVLQKIEILGTRNFKTYWIGTSTELFHAFNLKEDENKELQFSNFLSNLEPYATKGDDIEYANLLIEKATYQLKENPNEACKSIDEAYSFAPYLRRVLFKASIIHFENKSYKQALFYCNELIRLYPKRAKKSVKMGIHISLAAKNYQNAANLSLRYNKTWNDSDLIKEIEYRLSKGDRIHELINLFQN